MYILTTLIIEKIIVKIKNKIIEIIEKIIIIIKVKIEKLKLII